MLHHLTQLEGFGLFACVLQEGEGEIPPVNNGTCAFMRVLCLRVNFENVWSLDHPPPISCSLLYSPPSSFSWFCSFTSVAFATTCLCAEALQQHLYQLCCKSSSLKWLLFLKELTLWHSNNFSTFQDYQHVCIGEAQVPICYWSCLFDAALCNIFLHWMYPFMRWELSE